ncbi:MAG: hypothetical protein ABI595_02855 [Actinomycetota bacterium]
MKRSRFVALLVVGAFVLASCGGGDETDTPAPGDGGDGGGAIAGPLDAAECAKVVTAMAAASAAIPQVMSGEVGDLSTSVEQMEAFAATAPEEIRVDLATVAQAYSAYSAALEGSGWDPSSGEAPPPEVVAALTAAGQELQNADFVAASDRVQAWFAENCGS